jgi:IS605 OrfB family transposase
LLISPQRQQCCDGLIVRVGSVTNSDPASSALMRNWQKAKARVQRLHARIANVRRHYLHKASTTIRLAARANHTMVCIEDLQVRNNMSRSAAGTTALPGKNVKAKSGLNKAILDQGWGEFRRQLEYKVAWRGGYLVVVPPQNTSRRCPCCGHVSAHNRPTQARFISLRKKPRRSDGCRKRCKSRRFGAVSG